jgi:hypothetical protein
VKLNRLMECHKLRIIITLFIACLFVSNCWAEELKANGKKLPYHIYLSFDDGPLEGSEDIDDAVRVEKIKINVFVVGSYVRSVPRMRNYFQLYRCIGKLHILTSPAGVYPREGWAGTAFCRVLLHPSV